MTTPKTKGEKGAERDRVKREPPQRTGPIRSGDAKRPEQKSAPSEEPRHSHASSDLHVNEAVAEAVKSSYDVLTETIEQGRAAAKNFRQGDYNFREVPGDIETMGIRMLNLARQLSTTTFDLCEQMLREVSTAGGGLTQRPSPGVPPFRENSPPPNAQSSSDAPPSVSASDPHSIPLTIQFKGEAKAVAHTEKLARPNSPTSPDQIDSSPLAPRSGKSKPIADIHFHADLAIGLIATITIPDNQPPGTYVGLVEIKGQAIPLGMLVIEIVE